MIFNKKIIKKTTLTLITLQLFNILLLNLLGLSNIPLPWSFVAVLAHGFILSIFIAFFAMVIPILAIYYWLLGGVERVIAQQLFLYYTAFIGLTSLGLYGFMIWQELTLPAYPWLAYRIAIELPSGSEAFNHFIISLTLSYSLMFIALLFKLFNAKTKAEKIFGQAHFASAFEIEKASLYTHEGVVLGKAYGKTLKLPGYESVLVVAPTGSGKTTAIAVPNLIEWQGSGVFNDLKGELYKLTATYRKDILNNNCYLWSPCDATKTSARYNPFYYVNKNPELQIRDLQLIAEILIPATKMGDGFWYQSSREIFLTLALYLFESKGTATLSEIHDLSKQEHFFTWLNITLEEQAGTFSKMLAQNAFAILQGDDKTRRNILKDFHSRMSLFNDPIVCHATNHNDFDLRNIRKEKMSIYINISDADKERLSPLLTLFWAQLINMLSEKEPQLDEPYGVLALMDEFGNMAKINKLKDGMSFLRSYHLRCIIIVQYLAQIKSVYGQYDAKGFLNAKVKIAFSLNDMDDAQFFSKSLGNKTVKVNSSAVSSGHGDNPGSRSENINYQSRALMTPDEIMQLSQKKEIILMESKNPILADKNYWFEETRYEQIELVTSFVTN